MLKIYLLQVCRLLTVIKDCECNECICGYAVEFQWAELNLNNFKNIYPMLNANDKSPTEF